MQSIFDEPRQVAKPRQDNAQDLSHGLAKLVLTLLETLRQLMENQARRRIEEGVLTEDEVERLGLAFMNLDGKMSEIASKFDLSRKDLQLNFSSDENSARGGDTQLVSLVDLLDRVIEKGLVVFGDLGISLADVELINVQLRLMVSSSRKLRTGNGLGRTPPANAKRVNRSRRRIRKR
jgi:AraC-like DNA-binding protein